MCSRAIDAGVDVEELRQLMGHKSIITTQRYIHLYGNKWEQAAAKLGKGKKREKAEQAGDLHLHLHVHGERGEDQEDVIDVEGEVVKDGADAEADHPIASGAGLRACEAPPVAHLRCSSGGFRDREQNPQQEGQNRKILPHPLPQSALQRLFGAEADPNFLNDFASTGGRTRTDTGSPPLDFESSASANFATPASTSGNSELGAKCQAHSAQVQAPSAQGQVALRAPGV